MSNKYKKKISNPNEGIAWAIKGYLGNFCKHKIIDVRTHSMAMNIIEEQDLDMIILESHVNNQSSLIFVQYLREQGFCIPVVLYSKNRIHQKLFSDDVLIINGKDNITEKIKKFEIEHFCVQA